MWADVTWVRPSVCDARHRKPTAAAKDEQQQRAEQHVDNELIIADLSRWRQEKYGTTWSNIDHESKDNLSEQRPEKNEQDGCKEFGPSLWCVRLEKSLARLEEI